MLDLGSGLPVLYAVAARDATATLDLLADLVPVLPERFVITGPVGLADRLAATHRARWVLPHRKMHLARPDELPPEDGRVEVLGRGDVADVLALRASDDDASAFFVPELVDTGHFLGIRDRGRLVAAAGAHVLAETAGVAAIGNVLTHPAHRRRGLARAVVATLARRLDALVPTVGLNVGVTNTAAQALYRTIGFEPLITYDEAELVRTRVTARSEEATT